MTYTTAARRYRRRPRPSGLSGVLEDIFAAAGIRPPPSGEAQCIDAANQTLAPFDAKVDDLVKTWNPTGFYSSSDLRGLVSVTLQAVTRAQAAVDAAASEANASQDSVMRATDDLARAGSRSLDYLDAARTADQQGLRLVNAPGLKRWVTDTLATASSAMVTAMVIGCITPWWVGAMAAFQSAFDVAWAFAKRLTGAVIAIGETVLKVADDLPDLYGLLKYALIAGGAYWLYIQLHNLKSSGRTVL
jgi:hypothetical protein